MKKIMLIIVLIISCVIGYKYMNSTQNLEDDILYSPSPLPTVSKSLEKLIHQSIIDSEKNENEPVDFIGESHTVLDIQTHKDITVVYMIIYTSSYKNEDIFNPSELGILPTSGCHMPVIFYFQNQQLINQWTPLDGSEYLPSIKKHFPRSIWYNTYHFMNLYGDKHQKDVQNQLDHYINQHSLLKKS